MKTRTLVKQATNYLRILYQDHLSLSHVETLLWTIHFANASITIMAHIDFSVKSDPGDFAKGGYAISSRQKLPPGNDNAA